LKYVSNPNLGYFLGPQIGNRVAYALESFLKEQDNNERLYDYLFTGLAEGRRINGYGTVLTWGDADIWIRVKQNTVSVRFDPTIPRAEPLGTSIHVMTEDEAVHVTTIRLPSVLRGLQPLPERNPYVIYAHSPIRAAGEPDRRYTGITKQGWMKRWRQHYRAAVSGSQYLFHRAIREHLATPRPYFRHEVLHYDLTFDEAMELEEILVRDNTLNPKGLNMIPGGFAGMRYLHMLGALSKDRHREEIENRAELLARFIRENPALKALWADPEWAANVICGHSGRLTLEQVRAVRELAKRGHQAEQILELVDARNIAQVRRLLRGDTYSRVA
jgi:hypothetical protein